MKYKYFLALRRTAAFRAVHFARFRPNNREGTMENDSSPLRRTALPEAPVTAGSLQGFPAFSGDTDTTVFVTKASRAGSRVGLHRVQRVEVAGSTAQEGAALSPSMSEQREICCCWDLCRSHFNSGFGVFFLLFFCFILFTAQAKSLFLVCVVSVLLFKWRLVT